MQSIYPIAFIWILVGLMTAYLAKNRGRSPFIWFFVGLFLGLLGLAMLFIFPNKEQKQSSRKAVTNGSGFQEAHQEAALPSEDNSGSSSFNRSQQNLKRIPGSLSIKWYFIDSSSPQHEVLGPMNITEMRKSIHEKRLDENVYIWCEHFEDWAQVSEFSNRSILLDKDYLEDPH